MREGQNIWLLAWIVSLHNKEPNEMTMNKPFVAIYILIWYLSTYGLFNDAVSWSEYIVTNDRLNNELESTRIWK
jgi:hypothetical protein